ncbi:MAG: lytic murein transglycosylase, partial [Candidatus Anstonellales archaeon]
MGAKKLLRKTALLLPTLILFMPMKKSISQNIEEAKNECFEKEFAYDIANNLGLWNLNYFISDSRFCLHKYLPFSFKKGGEKPYEEYRLEMNIYRKVDLALYALKKYEKLFYAAEKYYGIDKYTLSSIISIETSSGAFLGSYKLINALFSMYYHSPKKEFWAMQLRILDKNVGLLDPFLPSSPAGAFGICQFLPSSFERYSIDFNKDGKIDLFSWPDAIGSVARFLYAHGYKKNREKAI